MHGAREPSLIISRGSHAAFLLDELAEATSLVRSTVPPTPAYAWPLLRKRIGAEVVVKHENHATGALKVRGRLVYFGGLRRSGQMPKGAVTATRRNHGQSIAVASARHGIPFVIVVPKGNSNNARRSAFYGAIQALEACLAPGTPAITFRYYNKPAVAGARLLKGKASSSKIRSPTTPR